MITERDYWRLRSAEHGLDTVGLMRLYFEPSGDHLIRSEMAAIVGEVQAVGQKAGLLTNDLSAFHAPSWRHRITVLSKVSPLVDLSVIGYLKPDPRGYGAAIEAMNVEASEIVFVDDQPANVAGARAAGMTAVWFDATDVAGSIASFRSALVDESPQE